MKIQIRARGVKLTERERELVQRKMNFALALYGERIDRVVLHLSAERHPAGDKRCRVEVIVRPRAVRVEHTAANVLTAVGHAAKLAARSVARVLKRQHAAHDEPRAATPPRQKPKPKPKPKPARRR